MKKITAILLLFCLCMQFSVYAESSISRIEFITYILNRLELNDYSKTPGFSDISEDDENYPIAASAKEYGIINGYDDNTLRPNEYLTRQDAVVMLSRAYKVKLTNDILIKGFADYDKISDYAKGYVSLAVQNGILKYSMNDNFRPRDYITRTEAYALADAFKNLSGNELNFAPGYPKEISENTYGMITVRIKVTKPCDIFYTLVPDEGYLGGFKPNAEQLDRFLSSISIAGTAMDFNIYPGNTKKYNLYITARGEDGKYTSVETLMNVSAHLFEYGTGTAEDPYLIYTKEQLKGIGRYPNKCFRLESDIENVGSWTPISAEKDGYLGFSGNFDGNFHKISELQISGTKNVGLFSTVYGAKIQNLYVDATVSGEANAGIIAGMSEGGRIERCIAVGRVSSQGNNAGGIVGSNSGEIRDSISAAYMVEASAYAGGITGTNRGDIINCLSAAYSVSSDMYASSAAGANIGGTVKNTVCASAYARDVITTRSGRVTTNKQSGVTSGNYCYDKMVSHSAVNFGEESQDGLEVSWDELVSPSFYRDIMKWDIKNVWQENVCEDFRLLSLKGFDGIDMIKGITSYAPIKISDEKGLLEVSKNTDYHYILTDDISLSGDDEWEVIADNDGGFNGTFDGNNHKISGIYISKKNKDKQYGMFGTISAGTVRNLKLERVSIEGDSTSGVIAASNYGNIYNCKVSGKLYSIAKDKSVSCGGVVGNNYGVIEYTSSSVKIKTDGSVSTIGGIAANNEGFINHCSFSGKIQSDCREKSSNAVIGGLVGINTSGNVYNSSSVPSIVSRACFNYVGGAAGIVHGGEIYKTFIGANMTVNSVDEENAVSYAGGTAGLAAEGLIFNNLCKSVIYADSGNVYAGGILGFNRGASVQNNYTSAKVSATSKGFDEAEIFAAGICGAAEGGFILDNVYAGTAVKSDGYADGAAHIINEYAMCANNYVRADADILGKTYLPQAESTKVELEEIQSSGLYFAPIADGGRLGWDNSEVWYWNANALMPYLQDVKNG